MTIPAITITSRYVCIHGARQVVALTGFEARKMASRLEAAAAEVERDDDGGAAA